MPLTIEERDALLKHQKALLAESIRVSQQLEALTLRLALVAAQLAEDSYPQVFARGLRIQAEREADQSPAQPPLSAFEVHLAEQEEEQVNRGQ
jgi:hypothetical protein